MRLDYHLLDVFTDRQFGGNQLAVFLDPPQDLPKVMMQRIAQELNLSETTFLFPPVGSANDYRLRIFTPAAELPIAGHPTVGTAFALARLGRLDGAKGDGAIVFEEGVGPIAVTIEADEDGAPRDVWMRQPIPQFHDIIHDRQGIADMLSLAEADLLPGAPLQVVSSGLPFLYVPVRSLEAAGKAQLKYDRWRSVLAGSDAQNIFLMTTETVLDNATAHSRMFAPALGVSEDPATGSASGPLGAYLLKYGLSEADDMISEQGVEMGRPSIIRIRIERNGAAITGVVVGGRCAYMGYGSLLID